MHPASLVALLHTHPQTPSSLPTNKSLLFLPFMGSLQRGPRGRDPHGSDRMAPKLSTWVKGRKDVGAMGDGRSSSTP
eukprot:scaffold155_cov347-Pavlova_lutheri.AAC.12